MMDALRYIGIIAIFAGTIYSFHKIRQRPEYEELRKRNLARSLNFIFLLPAFWYKKEPALKPAYVKLAKIGLVHVFGALFGMLGYPTLLDFIYFYMTGRLPL
ncbi:hypothetical protein PSE_p0310 (plasmid) [Pseudovibrio sp. FO-BEG1]|uniref:hypothetical protein n=1 Tax=Pseudovibrio sp. (strain FO-BEG1) TaxID=911045 RepID=UPI000238D260|nr:hypothetical protein [Pseudovibrio sp. FO-BEG1]AEV39892.1 hypothetical protein PSE_p0310 [Pseudovibrio sp. FO-BEG1]